MQKRIKRQVSPNPQTSRRSQGIMANPVDLLASGTGSPEISFRFLALASEALLPAIVAMLWLLWL